MKTLDEYYGEAAAEASRLASERSRSGEQAHGPTYWASHAEAMMAAMKQVAEAAAIEVLNRLEAKWDTIIWSPEGKMIVNFPPAEEPVKPAREAKAKAEVKSSD